MNKYLTKIISGINAYLPRIAVLIAIILIAGAGVAFAQFARQTGDIGWGYGYGYGYGLGYGWDGGLLAGRRILQGGEWAHYTTSNSDISTKSPWSLATDPNGSTVWINLGGYGIQKFDGDSTWTTYNTSNSDIYTDSVQFLRVDNNGDLWYTDTLSGVGYFDVSEDTWIHYTTSNSDIAENTTTRGLPFDFDSENNIWIAHDRFGLSKFDGLSWTIYNTSNSDIVTNELYSVVVDDQDTVWIGTGGYGIQKFDGDSTWTTYNTSNSDLVLDWAVVAAHDSGGTVWYIPLTPGGGVGSFDGDSTWTHYTNTTSGLAEDTPFAVMVDDLDNVWFSAYDIGEGSPETITQKFDGSTWETIDDAPFVDATIGGFTSDDTAWFLSRNAILPPYISEIASLTQDRLAANVYGYGYGYGYMEENASGGSQISWNDTEGRYEASATMYDYVVAGILVPYSGTFIGRDVQFLFAIEHTFSDGDVLTIPARTIFDAGEVVDFRDLEADESLESAEIASIDGTVVGDLSFGLPADNLTADNDVTIAIYVGAEYNSETLNVYHQSPESSSWSLLTTCVVADGFCEFTTTSFSSFAAVQPSSSSTGGGSVSKTSTAKVCTETSYEHTRTLKEGSAGTDVRNLQEVLVQHDYLDVEPDGDFGLLTANAVRALQLAYNMTPDGIVGSQTGSLIEALAACDDWSPEEPVDTLVLRPTSFETPEEPAITQDISEDIDLVVEETEEVEEVETPLTFEPLVQEEPEQKTCKGCWVWVVVIGIIPILILIKQSRK